MITPGPYQSCTGCNKTTNHTWVSELVYQCRECGKETKVPMTAKKRIVVINSKVQDNPKEAVVPEEPKFKEDYTRQVEVKPVTKTVNVIKPSLNWGDLL